MYSTNVKMNDTIQLQQKIIYFKAELAKYQAKVKDYENDYHYSQLKKLKEENLQLMEEKKAISLQLKAASEEFENSLEEFKNQVVTFTEQESSFHSRLSQKQEEIERLKKEKETYEKDLGLKIDAALAKEKEINQHKIAKLEQTINGLKENNEALTSNLQKLNDERKSEEQKHVKFTQKIQSLQNELHDSNKDKSNFKKHNHDLQEEINHLKTKIIQMEDSQKIDTNETEIKLQETHVKLENALKNHQQYEKDISALNQENSDLKTMTSQLKEELLENKNHNKQLTEQITALQKASEDYSSLQEAHDLLKQEMQNSQHHLNEMYIKFNDSHFNHPSNLSSEGQQADDITTINELDILKQLEYQFKELLDQSFEYEEQLDSKFIIIHELENKLNELTQEIEEIQNNTQTEELISNQDDTEWTT
ncbi:hypothetical protein [Halalkalibacter alkalisediminis]|uniref:Chromosome partition protein Smc n=1 Tax=Halalkalibacter alkalisediminis TaxID=935616 RepID=A0ABV6NMH8_9BACI|nr:hypothetical protein [Halalkalibacter alkalisediminis]